MSAINLTKEYRDRCFVVEFYENEGQKLGEQN